MIRKLLALSVLLCTAIFASADNFTFTFTGQLGNNGSGTLVTTPLSGGQFEITAITNGMLDGVAIALLPPGIFLGDNLLFFPPTPGYLDGLGFNFEDANGNEFDISLAPCIAQSGEQQGLESPSCPPIYFLSASDNLPDTGNFTITPVGLPPIPEPSSILLLGTGLLGAAGAIRCKLIAK